MKHPNVDNFLYCAHSIITPMAALFPEIICENLWVRSDEKIPWWTIIYCADRRLGPLRSRIGDVQQNFQYGIILWPRAGGAYPLWDAIAQHFTNGTMYYTPSIGLHYIGAGIRQAWWNKGGQTGVAGYPVSDEGSWYPGGAVQTFQGGTFYFTPQYGTKLIQGAIRAEYENNGGYFYMGRPVTDLYAANATTRAQQFEDGVIYWSDGRTWVERW